MTSSKHETGLRNRLLANENWESVLRERYEAEVQALLIQKLTPVRRWSFVFVSIALVGFSILTGWLAATMTELPTLARLMFIEGTILQMAVVVYCICVIRSGVFHARRHPLFLSGVMWCFSVFLAIHFLVMIPDIQDVRIGVLFVGVSVTTMIGAGFQLLRTCIEQSELNTHERLLETVLRLTQTTNVSGDSN